MPLEVFMINCEFPIEEDIAVGELVIPDAELTESIWVTAALQKIREVKREEYINFLTEQKLLHLYNQREEGKYFYEVRILD